MNRYKFLNELDEWGHPQHLHTLDGRALIGTSTVLSILNKPLAFWAAELAAVECLEVGQKIPTIREEYLLACSSSDKKKAIDELQKKYPIFKKARFAHFVSKKEKAEKGIDLHEVLERFCKGKELTEKELKLIDPFVQWSKENVDGFIASEGHCYSEKHWLGGIIDLVFRDKKGRLAIMDFKSSKEAYLSQYYQCAGYDLQISENGILDKDGNVLHKLDKPIDYYAIFPFGMKNPVPQLFHDTEEAKRAFLSALELHKIDKKYAI